MCLLTCDEERGSGGRVMGYAGRENYWGKGGKGGKGRGDKRK